jgi:hypothetical protein
MCGRIDWDRDLILRRHMRDGCPLMFAVIVGGDAVLGIVRDLLRDAATFRSSRVYHDP